MTERVSKKSTDHKHFGRWLSDEELEALKRSEIILPIMACWLPILAQMAKDKGMPRTKFIRTLMEKAARQMGYPLPKDRIGWKPKRKKTKAEKARHLKKLQMRRYRARKREELARDPEWFWSPEGYVGTADLDSLGTTAGMVDHLGVWHPESHRYTPARIAAACQKAMDEGELDGERWQLFVRRYGGGGEEMGADSE